MDFGLTQEQIILLTEIVKKYIKKCELIVYGSRAKGTYTFRSDIDLVIKHSVVADKQFLANIREDLEESDLPFLVDIQYFETIKNPDLIDHINRVGKTIYQQN